MRGILIDPYAQTVTEVEIGDDYREIYPLIDARSFDVARIGEKGDGIYIDDEGLFHIDSNSRFFLHREYGQPLVGKGLLLGCDLNTGESQSTTYTVEEVREAVTFMTAREAYFWAVKHGQ